MKQFFTNSIDNSTSAVISRLAEITLQYSLTYPSREIYIIMLAFVGKRRRKTAVFVMFIHDSFQQEVLELQLIESSL